MPWRVNSTARWTGQVASFVGVLSLIEFIVIPTLVLFTLLSSDETVMTSVIKKKLLVNYQSLIVMTLWRVLLETRFEVIVLTNLRLNLPKYPFGWITIYYLKPR